MIRSLRPAAAALVALVLLCAPCTAAAAQVPARRGPVVGSRAVSPLEATRIARFWTPRRMRSARPLGGAGGARATGRAVATASARLVPAPTEYPYETAGRIFGRTAHELYWCSGVAINTPSRRAVLTAGHCVNDRQEYARHGSWAQSLIFVPAYTNGQAPFGRFVMEAEYAPAAWLDSQNPNYDLGGLLTYPNEAGALVADATGGGANVALGLPPDEQVYSVVGYPGANQQHMWTCDAYFAGLNPFARRRGGPAQILGSCWMAPGSSGGPWFTGEPPVLNGLTSEDVQRRAFDHYLSTPYFGYRNLSGLLAAL